MVVSCNARATPSSVPVVKSRLDWIISMSLEPWFRHTCDDALKDNSLLYHNGSNILSLPCGTFNPPSHTSTVGVSGRTPSNLGVELKADASTLEYKRHRACPSVKTSTDEPSHVPLHARTLRGAALSS